MENYDLESKFIKVVPGRNFITNLVAGFFKRGSYICELSYSDTPFLHSYIYGVTVVDEILMRQEFDLCKCFTADSLEEAKKQAMDYINSLN